MSEAAEPIRSLTAWLELTDCSVLFDSNAISNDILELIDSDPEWECNGVLWNEDNTTIIQLELMRWDSMAPDLTVFFEPLTHHMQAGEYLTFEGKVKFGHRSNTLMVILVSARGVTIADGNGLTNEIRRLTMFDDDYTIEESL